MWTIVLDISGPIQPVSKSWVAPFSTVFALWNTRVHVHATDSSNIVTDVKSLIDNTFYFGSIL